MSIVQLSAKQALAVGLLDKRPVQPASATSAETSDLAATRKEIIEAAKAERDRWLASPMPDAHSSQDAHRAYWRARLLAGWRYDVISADAVLRTKLGEKLVSLTLKFGGRVHSVEYEPLTENGGSLATIVREVHDGALKALGRGERT